jgi:uncharacterized alkaline shock family protein YloU
MFKKLIKQIFSVPVSAVKKARSASGEFLLKKTDFGLVRVEFEVVRKISERALRSVKGIKETELTVEKLSEANPLKIRLTTTLVEGYSAPRISEAIDKAINNALKEYLQLEFYVPVDVKVKEIAQIVTKRRRVR